MRNGMSPDALTQASPVLWSQKKGLNSFTAAGRGTVESGSGGRTTDAETRSGHGWYSTRTPGPGAEVFESSEALFDSHPASYRQHVRPDPDGFHERPWEAFDADLMG